jgi:FkbM family methyltransferase
MITEVIKFLDKKKNIIIIAGANIGQEVKFFSKLNCELHLIEPHPVIFQKLVSTNFSTTNSTLFFYNIALSNKNKFQNLYYKNDKNQINGGAALIKKINSNTELYDKVETVSASDFIARLNKNIDLLYIDIEASEYDVLNSLIYNKKIHNISNIFFESHERKLRIVDKIFYLLKKYRALYKLKFFFNIRKFDQCHYMLNKK